MRLSIKLARNVETMYETDHSHLADCSHSVSSRSYSVFLD